jgi:hypothetical protein
MSVTVEGVTHYLVSYYNTDDVKGGLFQPLSQAPALSGIRPRPELILKQRFCAPLGEVNKSTDGARKGHQGMDKGYWPLGQSCHH